MRKVFHQFLVILLSSQLSILNSSCTQDVYEKGEGELSAMVAEMGDGFTASLGAKSLNPLHNETQSY